VDLCPLSMTFARREQPCTAISQFSLHPSMGVTPDISTIYLGLKCHSDSRGQPELPFPWTSLMQQGSQVSPYLLYNLPLTRPVMPGFDPLLKPTIQSKQPCHKNTDSYLLMLCQGHEVYMSDIGGFNSFETNVTSNSAENQACYQLLGVLRYPSYFEYFCQVCRKLLVSIYFNAVAYICMLRL